MSSFNSLSLFSSGPHRFFVGPMGSQLIDNTTISPTTPGRQSIGSLDGIVTVRGRLVAATEADLWSLIDTLTAQLTTPPTAADLVDSHARSFKNMSFISLKLLAPFDRARTVSVPYEALFTQFGAWS
jgi:hypothetical protein